jgi:hypothetical protein
MKLRNKLILALIGAWILVGSAGAAYYVKNGGLQGNIASRAAHLQKTKSDLNFLLVDLSRLQQNLAAFPQRQLPSEQTQVLRARITNEQTGVQSDLLQIVEDTGYLQGHRSALTPQQKDLVDSIQKNRT